MALDVSAARRDIASVEIKCEPIQQNAQVATEESQSTLTKCRAACDCVNCTCNLNTLAPKSNNSTVVMARGHKQRHRQVAASTQSQSDEQNYQVTRSRSTQILRYSN